MPCFEPINAWQTKSGDISIGKNQPDSSSLRLPCGGCLGCRRSRAAAWMLRCTLEMQQHKDAVFTTLTYNDENLPPTLRIRDLQLWLKRVRHKTARPIRFFASGEYGEQNERPHYHAIVYALSVDEQDVLDHAWQTSKSEPLGFTKTVAATPATIAYVAGYNAKAIGWKKKATEERVDPTTGEVYTWQPPFQQMSRRPGIGGHARTPQGMGPHQLHTIKTVLQSWRAYAVHNGHEMPVPRFLHESWKQQATTTEIEQLTEEKIKKAILRDTTEYHLKAAEQIAKAQQQETKRKRKL